MTMKEKFTDPEVEIILLEEQDVIITSGCPPELEGDPFSNF